MSIVQMLRSKIRQIETSHAKTQIVLPFAVEDIDQHLPDKGLRLGAFHECAGSDGWTGDAAATMFAAGIMARLQGPVVWCLRQRDLFAPALEQAGLAMHRIHFIEAGNDRTLLDCFEEALRHPGIAGVVGEISKMSMTQSRRLQLAAESSGALGIGLWRWRKSEQPTAAQTSWRLSALPSASLPVAGLGRARWKLELLRCRGAESSEFNIEACDETGHIALSSTPIHRSGEAADGQQRAIAR